MDKKIVILTLKCLGLAILINLFFNILNELFIHLESSGNPIDKLPKSEQVFLGIIVAPLLETFIAQHLLMKILKLKITNERYLLILSSLFFASMHYYNWVYIVVTFFIGLVFNYYYLETQKGTKYPFLLTASLHATYNLYCFLISLIS